MSDSPMKDRWYKKAPPITEDHVKLARRINIVWLDDIEWGSVGLDPKRPFGNSDMTGDVAEILGWIDTETRKTEYELTAEQGERAKQLHFEMGYVLKSAMAGWLDWAEGSR